MVSKSELLLEEQYLKRVLKEVDKNIELSNINVSKHIEDVYSFKNFIWKECRALATSNDFNQQVEYTAFIEESNKRVDATNDALKKHSRFLRIKNSPYFGKITFNNENIYIGVHHVGDLDDILVYDWRAPISSLFYNYTLGDASYLTKEGIIKGKITKRRLFNIENGKINWCFDNDQNINDKILQEVLSKESSDRMKNIVNTIQKEQDTIIRNKKDNVLIIEGVPGSGKTEVALHRIAYLLYDKERYNASNILIISPNNTFSKYISNVLPELNEDNILNTTYALFAQKYINKELENYYDYLERIYKYDLIIDFENNYLDTYIKYLKDFYNNIEFEYSLRINNEKISKELLNKVFKKNNNITIMERLNYLCSYLLDYLHIKHKYYDVLKNKLIESLNSSIEPIDLFNKFLEDNNLPTVGDIVQYEYIPYLLYTIFYVNDYPITNEIKHIVIDEAQDYSIFQLALLKQVFPKASYTILGDTNQSLNKLINYKSMEVYLDVFKDAKYYKLNKAYRSSKNIMDYAGTVLNIKIDCFRNPGTNVLIRNKTDIESLKKDIKHHEQKRMAIVTKDKKTMEYLYNNLKDEFVVGSPLINNKESNILILPIYVAKGLEFNTTIIFDKNAFTNKELYVASTRAQNNLIIYQ